jgi:hypothetical protein
MKNEDIYIAKESGKFVIKDNEEEEKKKGASG